MISPEVKRALDNRQTPLVVIWTAFIVSLIVSVVLLIVEFPSRLFLEELVRGAEARGA